MSTATIASTIQRESELLGQTVVAISEVDLPHAKVIVRRIEFWIFHLHSGFGQQAIFRRRLAAGEKQAEQR